MSRTESPSSSLPEPIRAILELFAGPLAEVQFPNVDHRHLSESLAVVEERREQLQLALEQVQQAREQLELSQKQLNGLARRAHAYAVIYAEDNAELSEQIAAIKLDARKLAPKKRSRSRKSSRKQQTNLAVAEDAA